MRVRRHRAVLEDGTHVVRFSNDGVSVTSDVGRFTYKWRLFTGLWTAADLLLLVLVGRAWLALPRKAVSPELPEYIRTCLRVSRGRLRCNKCGYDLRGQTVPRCPECGTEFEPRNWRFGRTAARPPAFSHELRFLPVAASFLARCAALAMTARGAALNITV